MTKNLLYIFFIPIGQFTLSNNIGGPALPYFNPSTMLKLKRGYKAVSKKWSDLNGLRQQV
jgi:hypothetical protein